jgi:hypothetical protein
MVLRIAAGGRVGEVLIINLAAVSQRAWKTPADELVHELAEAGTTFA